MTDYDRAGTARRILNWAGKHDADGNLVGVAVGTDAKNVIVDAATMVRLLDNADAAEADAQRARKLMGDKRERANALILKAKPNGTPLSPEPSSETL